MTRERVQAWLDAYVTAWRTYDEAANRDLFAPGARYAYHPQLRDRQRRLRVTF